LRVGEKKRQEKVTALTCQEIRELGPENVKEFNDGCVFHVR
jgi:hypothetical protein